MNVVPRYSKQMRSNEETQITQIVHISQEILIRRQWLYSNGQRLFTQRNSGTHQRHPFLRSLCISVALVTNWLFYDFIYTEWHMGLPTHNDNMTPLLGTGHNHRHFATPRVTLAWLFYLRPYNSKSSSTASNCQCRTPLTSPTVVKETLCRLCLLGLLHDVRGVLFRLQRL